jgi:alanine-synthesizing transaminase
LFSSRTNWHRQHNPLTEALEDLKKSGRSILDLTESNPTRCRLTYPVDVMQHAFVHPGMSLYNPEPLGLSEARNAIRDYYSERTIPLDAGNIILTASTSEAYAMCFKLLCEADDEVLIPVPSYPLFEFLAQLNDVRVRPYHLRYDGEWHIDMSSVRDAISPHSRAIVVVNPHNPTGMFLKSADLELFSDMASGHDLALISDEVFSEYCFMVDPTRVKSTANSDKVLTFTLNGISKLGALPQMKLGWIAVSGPARIRQEALERLEIIADTYLSVNTPAQIALPRLLKDSDAMRRRITVRLSTNLDVLRRSLESSVCSMFEPEGGWYVPVRVPGILSAEEWAIELLRETGVHIHPGYFFEFGDDRILVLSLLPEEGIFREGVQRLLQFVGSKSHHD